MRQVLAVIEIPEYITHVKLSSARKTVYYNIYGKRKPPKSLLKKDKYKITKDGYLIDKDTGLKIVANYRSVGKPKFEKINGQDFYSGFGSPFTRNTMVKEIKAFFSKHVKDLPPIVQFPIQFECELHTTIDNADWDLDNLWIYTKCFQDVLVEHKIIPDDNIQFVTKPAAPEFFPIKDTKNRKLVYTIYKDPRNISIMEPISNSEIKKGKKV